MSGAAGEPLSEDVEHTVVRFSLNLSLSEMMENFEQRYCIKFCQQLGDTQAETIRKMQQAFGDNSMSISRLREGFIRLKNDCTSVDSEPRSGRPSTCLNENVVQQVQTLVLRDRRITVREITNEIGISIGSVHAILTKDSGLKRVSAKSVPKLLTMKQKQWRVDNAQDMMHTANSDQNFLK